MKIASSTLQMQAQHVATHTHSRTSRLEVWVGERSASGTLGRQTLLQPLASAARLSQAAQAAQVAQAALASATMAEPLVEGSPEEALTPQLAMLRDLIERMTGVVVRVYTGLQPSGANNAPTAVRPPTSPPANGTATPRQRAGLGLAYEQREVREEAERTELTATGTVRTADGRDIRFTLQLDMQRSYREESSVSLRLGDAVAVDPLVINFDGTAAQLQDLRFAFDLDSDGQTEQVPLLAGNRGYLALDTNHNARIDNGRELFGPHTGNGFAELAQHDEDGNGWIDEADPVFGQLRVWTPNADGSGTLRTLEELGVGAVQLNAVDTPFALRTADNRSLGTVRSTSLYLQENGIAGTVQQIDLSV